MPLLRFIYGAHLSKEQVAQLVAPHPDMLEVVGSWLEIQQRSTLRSNDTRRLADGRWRAPRVCVPSRRTPRSTIHYHAGTNDTIIRMVGHALPAALNMHVQTVVPMSAFTITRFLQQTSRSRSGGAAARRRMHRGENPRRCCRAAIETRNHRLCIRLYKTSTYTPGATEQSMLGIAGF
jgi:tripeptidyl-peptidase-1